MVRGLKSPLPAGGERARVRGRSLLYALPLTLTLTLSPLVWGEGTVVARLSDNCSACSVSVHEGREAVSMPLAAFLWRPGIDVDGAVLRFSVVASAATTITIGHGTRTLDTRKLEDGRAFEIDLAIGKLARNDEITFAATAPDVHWLDPVILAPARDRARPNILIIVVDTLRADRLVGPHSAMPRTLAWTQRGTRFTRAYANAPWTLPSISSLLTGVFPGIHNAGRRTILGPVTTRQPVPHPAPNGYTLTIGTTLYEFHRLSRSVPTLAQLLGSAGYYTTALYENAFISHPIETLRGFDMAREYGVYDAAVGTDRALEWIGNNRPTRFAAFVHYIDVHQWPLAIPDELKKVPVKQYTPEQRAMLNDLYDRQCGKTDIQIDRLLAGLRDMGLLEKTIVVITADHGEAIAEYGRRDSHGASVEEHILRVPLAIFGPGIPSREVTARVSLVDVVPTLLDYARIGTRAQFSGQSLRHPRDHDFISEFVLYESDKAAVYSGRWKYVWQESKEQLFDLEGDPEAVHDVAAAHPELVQRMRRDFRKRQIELLAKMRAERGENLSVSQETLDALRALGYVH